VRPRVHALSDVEPDSPRLIPLLTFR
jgi:hypothetical protein